MKKKRVPCTHCDGTGDEPNLCPECGSVFVDASGDGDCATCLAVSNIEKRERAKDREDDRRIMERLGK